MNKWIGISLGAVVGISHIGMIGMLSRQSKFPVVNLPVGPYTSYQVNAGKEGYTINYRANDPLVMEVTKEVNKPGGFLGLSRAKMRTRELYTMDGSQHLEDREQGKLSAKQLACIKAAGGGESPGAMVGASVGAAAAPALSGIPFIGWVATGWATMVGSNTGSQIGGQMATEFADCDPDLLDNMDE